MVDDERGDSLSKVVSVAKGQILQDAEDGKNKLIELTGKIEEFEREYVRVFGSLSSGSLERTNGLKQELENLKNELKEYADTQRSKHEALFSQIESLLPSAASAGLAAAYSTERAKYYKPIIWSYSVFFCSVLAIAVIYAGELLWGKLGDSSLFVNLLQKILQVSPITIPLIWLAIYSSTRGSEYRRLEQEYAHKQALATSFSSFKKQVEELGETSSQINLLERLLSNMIDTVSKNASETLDKNHGHNTPFEALTKPIKDLQETIGELKK